MTNLENNYINLYVILKKLFNKGMYNVNEQVNKQLFEIDKYSEIPESLI